MAIAYTSAVNDILDSLRDQPGASPCDQSNQKLHAFKQSVARYAAEHDDLADDSATIRQILNSTAVDDIELILRHNLNYCDDCLLKMYRKISLS